MITGGEAVVYAVADRGTPQHEAVHAYCAQTFGRTGPTWYAEGMAEMGQYWKDKDASVNCHEVVVEYLKSEEPKELTEITAAGQQTGDSWQNYAWRWALCHLLANNYELRPAVPAAGTGAANESGRQLRSRLWADGTGNHVRIPVFSEALRPRLSRRPVQLGLEDEIHGAQRDIARCRPKSTPATAGRRRGSGERGRRNTPSHDRPVEDSKKTATTSPPAGADDGQGKLVGILFDDYELSEPFDLGDSGEWTAPQDGKLFLRCQDGWCDLADNNGTVTVKWKLAK